MSRGAAVRLDAGSSRTRKDPRHTRAAVWSRAGVLPLDGVTYLDHVNRLLPNGGRGPVENGGGPYPDDEPTKPGGIEWLPGALEGVLSLRGGVSSSSQPMLAAAAIAEACRHPLGTIAVHTVADRLAAMTAPSDVDRLFEELRIDTALGRLRLAELARWLCRFGTRQRQVQSGLALLAAVGGPQDREFAARLGLLGTLTMRAVDALQGILPDPDAEAAVFDLAKQTDGWGRIHAVYGLRGTTTPAVQNWLLRGGYDSGVIDEELAGIAAISGDLAGALQGEVDAELLHHSGRLLTALRMGGPAEELRDYPEGGIAIELYLAHAAEAPPTVEILSVVQILHRYLVKEADDNPHLDDLTRSRLTRLAADLLERPVWPHVAETALRSPNIQDVRLAVRPAARVGVDVRPIVLARLESETDDAYLWQELLVNAESPEQFAETILHAERLFDVENCAISPSIEQWSLDARDHCLEIIIGRLGAHPATGWKIVGAGLGDPVVQIRRCALRALGAWPDSIWPSEARPLLERLRWLEPDPELRAKFVELSERSDDGTPAQ